MNQIKQLLSPYDKDNYALVLSQYPSMDQDQKNELFLWIMKNIEMNLSNI